MIFLILLFLLLPSQLAFHFWPFWSLVNGIRVDYLSPTLYLTDFIVFGLFLKSRLRIQVPLPIIIFVVLNILISSFPLLTIYKWLRVLEYFWLFRYLISRTNYTLNAIRYTLPVAVLWTAILAWWQFFLQRSVGGFWYWLGERPLSVSTPLIAKISFFGNLFMRPYATFPHPNALAGFLLVVGLILYSVNRRITPAILIALLTIPLTFSRTAIILEVLVLLPWILLRITREARAKARCLKLKIISLLMLLISSIYFLVFVTGSIESLPDRISLIHNSLILIQKYPILGVGLGNFIPASGFYQPVHNIYLLLASELGLPAFVVICYFMFRNYLGFRNSKLGIAVAVIAITGAADHYWLTLHQNILLLVILIAYAYSHRRWSQR